MFQKIKKWLMNKWYPSGYFMLVYGDDEKDNPKLAFEYSTLDDLHDFSALICHVADSYLYVKLTEELSNESTDEEELKIAEDIIALFSKHVKAVKQISSSQFKHAGETYEPVQREEELA